MTEVSSSQAIETRPIQIREMPAVQARLLLRDQSALDPENTVEKLTLANTQKLAERSYLIFEEASLNERKTVQNKSKPFEERYATWSESVKQCFNSEQNKQKMIALSPLLGINGGVYGDSEVQSIYDKYFNTSNVGSGVRAFVRDVVMTCEKDGKYDQKIFDRNRESIKWFAQLFGSTSSEMIDQLIKAEVRMLENPEQCIADLNKLRNDISMPEKKMLSFIYNKEAVRDVHVVENGQLPVEKRKTDIQDLLRNPDVDKIVISAGTGAGKTTKIPQYIYELLGPGEKVAVTQPRRIAAQTLAETVRKQMGIKKFGDEIGYAHGKGKEATKDTKLLFTIEKSLLIQLARDPRLLKYNYVMVDEWHERHKDTDMLVALLQKAQELRKKAGDPPLKLIITSATINRADLVRQLGSGTESLEVEGNPHAIEDRFWKKNKDPLTRAVIPQRAVETAFELVQSRPSDRNILIFMPGDALISQTYEALMKEKDKLPPNVVIHKLTGSMTREQQDEVIRVTKMVAGKEVSDGKKHIIISSPIAETSLTVARVDVISSGLVNVPRVDPKTGLYFLDEILHSKYGLKQQRGRTGRESAGIWYYLGTEAEHKALIDNHNAEITRSDISDEILLLKKIKLELKDIDLVDKDKLPPENIARAHRRLKDLGALDAHDDITPIGEQMINIPLDIHYSRMIVEAGKRGCVRDATTIAAVCTQTDLYPREEEEEKNKRVIAQMEFAVAGSDFISRLRMFKAFEKVGEGELDAKKRETMREKWALEHHLNYDALQRIEVARADLLDRLDTSRDVATTDEDALGRCIYEGFKDNLLTKLPKSAVPAVAAANLPDTYELNGERVTNAVIDRDSMVDVTAASSQYVVAASNYPRQRVDADGQRRYIFMQMNQAVKREWLPLAA